MKCFVALFAVILAISAMPTDFSNEAFDTGNEDFAVQTDQEPVVIGQADIIMDSEAGGLNGTIARVETTHGLAGWGASTTGGIGGSTWTVWDAFALRDAIRATDRRIVRVRGRIDLTVLFSASPGVALACGNNKSIIGGDRNAMIFGGGLRLNNVQNIIIANIRFHNALSYAPGERPNGNGGITGMRPGDFSEIDAIEVRTTRLVWINHCEFADDPWNANSNSVQRRHDGLIDIVRGGDHVSVSNCIFRNHNHVALIGNSDTNAAQDASRLRVTYYLNWFRGTHQRNPRVRFGRVHILNNLYTDIRSYGVGVGSGARIFLERNCFINTRRAWGFAAAGGGTPNPMGNLAQLNNILRNSNHDSGIPGNANFVPSQHYSYTPMAAANVEAHVRRHAGIL